MLLRCFLFFGVATVAAVALRGEEQPVATTSQYRLVEISDGHFRCEVPKEWSMTREEREESRIHYHGFFLVGPKEEASLPPTISVRYFAPDNTLFSSAEDYLRRQLQPGLIKLQGETTSAVKEMTVDDRPAKTFIRDTFEFFPPESLDTKRIPIREEYYVVPHLGGFVVLKYAAPTSSFAHWRPALQRVLEAFRLFPEQAVVAIRITAPGLVAEDLEATVTMPFEAQLTGLAGLCGIRSTSCAREGLIRLAFKHNADFSAIRQELRRQLEPVQGQLPSGAAIAIEPAVADEVDLLLIALYTTDESRARPDLLGELEILAERVVRSRLTTVPGVAQAEIIGGRQRYEVVPSVERLKEHDVDMQELFAAIRQLDRLAGDDKRSAPTARAAIGRVESSDDVRRAPVVLRNGTPVLLGDVAEVRLGRVDGDKSRIWFSGPADETPRSPAAVLLAVRSLADTDSGAVFRAVQQVLNDVQTILPERVKLEHRVFGAADVRLRIRTARDGDKEQRTLDVEKAAAGMLRMTDVKSMWRVDTSIEGHASDGVDNVDILIAIEPGPVGRHETIVDEIRTLVTESLPMAVVSVGRPVAAHSRFPGVLGQFTVTLAGADLVVLHREAEDVRERLQSIPGMVDLQIEPSLPNSSICFLVNRDRATRYGLKSEESKEAAELATRIAGRYTTGKVIGAHGYPIDVTVMLDENEPANIARLPFRTPDGASIPFEAVLEISMTAKPEAVFRQNGRRVVVISCNSHRRDPDAVFQDILAVRNAIRLPTGYSIECTRD